MLSVLGFFVLLSFVKSTDYYVSTTGSDSNSGTSISSPFLTLSKASKALNAGDTLYLRGGTYYERLLLEYGITNSGTRDNPIEITSYNGETVVIDGTGVTFDLWLGLVTIQDVAHIYFHDISVQNSIGIGVTVRCYYSDWCGGDDRYGDHSPLNIHLANVEVSNTASAGIALNGREIFVEYCSIDEACTGGYLEAFSIQSIDGFIIEHNLIKDTQKETVDIKDNSQNGIFRYNEIMNQYVGGGTSIYIDGWNTWVKNVTLYGNYLHGYNNGFTLGTEEGGIIDGIYYHSNVARQDKNGAASFYIGTWNDDTSLNQKTNIYITNNYFEIAYDSYWSGRSVDIDHDSVFFENFHFENNIVTSPTWMFSLSEQVDSWDFNDWVFGNNIGIKNPNVNSFSLCNGCTPSDYAGTYYLFDDVYSELDGWDESIDTLGFRLKKEVDVALVY